MIPGTRVPAFCTKAPIEIFMIGGGAKINGQLALSGGLLRHRGRNTGGTFKRFRRLLGAWSEAPVAWLDAGTAQISSGF